MQDLGGYGTVAQCFEFLCTLDKNGSDIAPASPSRGSRTPDVRSGRSSFARNVKWQDGKPFSADDVVATMGRLVAAGNSGLKGVIDDKSAVATDANTVTFNLLRPERQLRRISSRCSTPRR
jgi:ABC-type transport system substrate-binding protein